VKVSRNILWKDGVGIAFVNSYFQLPGCFNCDDVFAECADAVFMDAWLGEYSKQTGGHTIALIRSPKLAGQIFCNTKKENTIIEKITLKKVIASQRSVIRRKRCRVVDNISLPKMRNNLAKRLGVVQRIQVRLMRICCDISAKEWIKSDKNIISFTQRMHPSQSKLNKLRYVILFYALPGYVIKKIVHIIRGICRFHLK
jgi:hypothetical protein